MPRDGQNRPKRPSFPMDGSAVHSSIYVHTVQLYRGPGFLNSARLSLCEQREFRLKA